ncbi:NAD(P)/FAD-dependent oxidoreductase [Jannaschia seohaensis]|uniref:Amine oxidase domain-containing protein n=1 Tax=Jannaschia seohaensis TaxID=475081 RepID=A0A2Y9AT99_9RHOB|nr:FAD-dependent oxidoreductase [Jannaschia seohaensis]PWJ17510.1 hypothetical protein BCF38_106121 [Jannaschia seohaensis]SSA47631.1 hypothetical protein SAMN05421539_106121 [Jannaschia seohaensis]
MAPTRPRIAIVGAGLCGLRLAQGLGHAAEVTVYEKSRGFGGRMATRRASPFAFDHGAQYMTAHGAEFRAFLATHQQAGRVRRWTPRLTVIGGGAPCAWTAPRWVAVPGMSSLAGAMAEGIDVRRETEIAGLARHGETWTLSAAEGPVAEGLDWVLLAIPSVQAARLAPPDMLGRDELEAVRMRGAYSLMVGLEDAAELPWDAAQVAEGPLGWIACNGTKPGRPEVTSILAQTGPDWAEANLERDQDEVRGDLLDALAEATEFDLSSPAYLRLHRWRYASVARPAETPCMIDGALGLGLAGDWCGTARPGRVEGAFDSAEALAEEVLARLG